MWTDKAIVCDRYEIVGNHSFLAVFLSKIEYQMLLDRLLYFISIIVAKKKIAKQSLLNIFVKIATNLSIYLVLHSPFSSGTRISWRQVVWNIVAEVAEINTGCEVIEVIRDLCFRPLSKLC